MDQTNDRLSKAVETCLALAVGNSDPFTRVAAYLTNLQDNGEWEEKDLLEVQMRVIRALMARIKAGE